MKFPNPAQVVTLVSAAAMASALLSPAAAYADESGTATVAALEALPEVLDDAVAVRETRSGTASFTSAQTRSSVQLPADSSEPIVMSNPDAGSLEIGLPFADSAATRDEENDVVSGYDNGNDSRTAPITKTDGSVQIITILESGDAPSRYTYDFSAKDGAHLDPSGPLLAVRDDSGSRVATIAPAWAVDADGRSVPTHYEVSGNSLTQVVDHRSGTFSYPIVADPYLGQALIARVDLGSEGGKPRYSVVKTAYGDNVAMGMLRPGNYDALLGATVMRTEGWKDAVAKRPAMNIATIKQQYDCHTVYAPSKNPWNLEAFRGQNANWGVNPKQCNW
ncbi:DUF2599 domain-containing protein [Leifsonia sp. F6_8S_P_1B]|uniref:DUF2599 domain-containing protein n=1 Tax=Leifsonia williamsii TaxID=3035919 RepID=A0ABT8K7I7_9MICO|nr:DUF2599 domain-containing protein [Leifsonia williamsii]MDN4613389.1 DUF2599 domain-containing protein [Leifsonia williamsii]